MLVLTASRRKAIVAVALALGVFCVVVYKLAEERSLVQSLRMQLRIQEASSSTTVDKLTEALAEERSLMQGLRQPSVLSAMHKLREVLAEDRWSMQPLHQKQKASPPTVSAPPTRMAVELLHPETRDAAAVLARNCSFVIYTSFAVGSGKAWPTALRFEKPSEFAPLFAPDQKGLLVQFSACFVVFADTPPAGGPPSGWHFIHNRRTERNMHFSDRQLSRLPKLMPTLLFGVRPTLFRDTKITLNKEAPAKMFSLLVEGSNFVAFAHPCQLAPMTVEMILNPVPCNTPKWIVAEAEIVSRAGRTRDGTGLVTTARKYAETLHEYDIYIDGAVLAQRDAAPLFIAWAAEYFYSDPPQDRDQPPFAHVFSLLENRPKSMTIVPWGTNKCKSLWSLGLCHWWIDGSFAQGN